MHHMLELVTSVPKSLTQAMRDRCFLAISTGISVNFSKDAADDIICGDESLASVAGMASLNALHSFSHSFKLDSM